MNVYKSLDLTKEESFCNKLLYDKKRFSNNKYLNKILLNFPPRKMSRPLMIHIETVNSCNHNCIFCAYEFNKEKRQLCRMSYSQK